ncbi:MAG: 50S ribosomal protein L24 [Acidilobaceae archaeon]
MSSQPRKVRAALRKAPLHRRQRLMTAPLSPELREKIGLKRLPVRKGDKVRIVRGNFAGQEGAVVRVNLKRGRIFVDGVTRKRLDGTPRFVPIHPSKVVIVSLDLKDEWRKETIERRAGVVEEVKEAPQEAQKEVRESGQAG